MRILSLFIIVLALAFTKASAQDFPYGQVDNDALNMTKYAKDTSAHAVMINEYGTSRIGFDNDYNILITYVRHAKIKFFDNKDFETEGTIVESLYNSNETRFEDITDIKAITYYKDENGNVQHVELDKSKIFRTRENKHVSTVKFALPALRSGCVVEFTYKISSPYLFDFKGWDFQASIPKIKSVYEVHIPGYWEYNASLAGPLKLSFNTAVVERSCLSYGSAAADCSDIVYGMNDVPAFVEEDYMTSAKNFKSAIIYQLVQETNLQSGIKTKYTKDWKDIDYLLKTESFFGSQLKRTSLLKDRIAPVLAGKTDQLEKAKAVYNFIKGTIKWDGHHDYASVDGIKQALDSHTGNSGDINLALVTALNAAGVPTEAVVLSTRANGVVNKLYPDLNSFNYVIAKANIGDQSYLLDATEPLLPFGMLPLRCLNDQGRVFSLDKPSYWIDMTTPQREKTTYSIDLTLQDDGKLKGTLTRFSTGYSAFLKRAEVKKFNSTDEYFDHVSGDIHGIKFTKSSISNVDSLDNPIAETYQVELNPSDKMVNNRIGLSPFLIEQIKTNPFKLARRDYPVDWGMPSEDRYIVTVHLPSQYTLENPPQPISYGLPNQGGNFITDFTTDGSTLTFSYITRINHSVYSTEEYPYLKELFNKIILAEKNELVFKKK